MHASFYVATVQRFDEEYEWNLRNGDVIFTLWNEPDRTEFGATEALGLDDLTRVNGGIVAPDLMTDRRLGHQVSSRGLTSQPPRLHN